MVIQSYNPNNQEDVDLWSWIRDVRESNPEPSTSDPLPLQPQPEEEQQHVCENFDEENGWRFCIECGVCDLSFIDLRADYDEMCAQNPMRTRHKYDVNYHFRQTLEKILGYASFTKQPPHKPKQKQILKRKFPVRHFSKHVNRNHKRIFIYDQKHQTNTIPQHIIDLIPPTVGSVMDVRRILRQNKAAKYYKYTSYIFQQKSVFPRPVLTHQQILILERMFKIVCANYMDIIHNITTNTCKLRKRKNMISYEWLICKLAAYMGIDLSLYSVPIRSRSTQNLYNEVWPHIEKVIEQKYSNGSLLQCIF